MTEEPAEPRTLDMPKPAGVAGHEHLVEPGGFDRKRLAANLRRLAELVSAEMVEIPLALRFGVVV